MTDANSRQVGGNHYKATPLQVWDAVHQLKLDFFQGNILKYVARWRNKDGVHDLLKARHYLDKYIELAQQQPQQPQQPLSDVGLLDGLFFGGDGILRGTPTKATESPPERPEEDPGSRPAAGRLLPEATPSKP